MADVKISNLPIGNPTGVGGGSTFPYYDADSGTTKQLPITGLLNVPDIAAALVAAGVISPNSVTNAMLAQVATAVIKGRTTASTGNVEDLTTAQVTAMLELFTSSLRGLVPASGGGTVNFLRADGSWEEPPGGVGTVTLASIQRFLAGSGTYTRPSGPAPIRIEVEILGGGGGGGGAQTSGTAGGGGAGGYRKFFIDSPSGTYSYSVGAGGVGATTSGIGTAGGDTTFGTSTAGGGDGGENGSSGNGGLGGVVSGSLGTDIVSMTGSGGQVMTNDAGAGTQGGLGGVGPFGGAGRGFNGTNGTCDAPEPNSGCGGNGGNSTTGTGSDGASGQIIVREYYDAADALPPYSPPRSEVWLTGGNGFGSTNTVIRRFSTVLRNNGSNIIYLDSSVNGATFTIGPSGGGLYTINHRDYDSNAGASPVCGASLNSAQLTTAIYNITNGNRLFYLSLLAGTQLVADSWTGLLAPGDVIRCHTVGSATAGTGNDVVSFHITQISG